MKWFVPAKVRDKRAAVSVITAGISTTTRSRSRHSRDKETRLPVHVSLAQ